MKKAVGMPSYIDIIQTGGTFSVDITAPTTPTRDILQM
jgi:hypothetical protein